MAETQPELLAHHYTEAGLSEQAIDYWERAGRRAVERSANVEAVASLTKALSLLKTRSDTPERAERAERRDLVQDALAALAPEQRAALALRHATRLTMQELANSLSCSIPTARSRLREAAHRFSVELRSRGVLEAEE